MTAALLRFTKPCTDRPLNPIACATPRRVCSQLRDLPDHFFGAIQRRGIGQLHDRDQILLVLRWNETTRHNAENPPGAEQQDDEDSENDPAYGNDAPHRAAVALGAPLKYPIEEPEEPSQHRLMPR